MNRILCDGLWEDESGSTTFDYTVIAALLSIVVIAAISANGNSLPSLIDDYIIAELDKVFAG
jgi:Flp pilus assembly pilin Flp